MKRILLFWVSITWLAWAERAWEDVRNFAYQLQNVSVSEICRSNFDLVILDYSPDGTRPWKSDEIQQMRRKPNGQRRLLLAYQSIGEAEDYRAYWKPTFLEKKVPWLESRNPEWGGNYKVRYWMKEWQSIAFRYNDQIVKAGFDGAYLDIVDAFEYFEAKGRTTARQEMINFVLQLAVRARKVGGQDFGIFPQNGEALLKESKYLEIITGIGKEDLYFGCYGDQRPNPSEVTRTGEAYLKLAALKGKKILCVDYVKSTRDSKLAHQRARAQGFIEYVTRRELDRLTTIPELQP